PKQERVCLERIADLVLEQEKETAGRSDGRHIGEAMVEAMEMALEDGPPEAAQLVACECVVLAETKDHLNWELIHEVADKSHGELRLALMAAYDQVEDEEDEHLYHTTGWCRDPWVEAAAMAAGGPPSRAQS